MGGKGGGGSRGVGSGPCCAWQAKSRPCAGPPSSLAGDLTCHMHNDAALQQARPDLSELGLDELRVGALAPLGCKAEGIWWRGKKGGCSNGVVLASPPIRACTWPGTDAARAAAITGVPVRSRTHPSNAAVSGAVSLPPAGNAGPQAIRKGPAAKQPNPAQASLDDDGARKVGQQAHGSKQHETEHHPNLLHGLGQREHACTRGVGRESTCMQAAVLP